VNLPVTNVPGCIGINAKKLGLQYLQFLDMGVCGYPPNGTRIDHHRTDELLIQQNTILDGEIASPLQERSKRSQSLCRFLPYLVDMLRPVEPFIKGNSKITEDVDPLDWLPEELYCSGVLDTPNGLGEKHSGALRVIDGDSPLTQPPFEAAEISLQLFDEERWLKRRGYVGRTVRIESQLDVAGR